MITIKCLNCGEEFLTYSSQKRKYCSYKCFTDANKGKPTWNKNIKGIGYKWKGKVLEANTYCRFCGKEFHAKPYSIKRGRSKFCNRKCYEEWGKTHFAIITKPASFYQQGKVGKNKERTKTPEWKAIRYQVYRRDKWTCQVCGKYCRDDIQCHHIVPYRITQDNSIGNLITLCRSCHIKEEYKYYRKLNSQMEINFCNK